MQEIPCSSVAQGKTPDPGFVWKYVSWLKECAGLDFTGGSNLDGPVL